MELNVIALIAHDSKKIEMAEWTSYNKDILKRFRLVGTEGTARSIRNITGLDVETFSHGPDGGDIRIANAVLDGKIGIVMFFIDSKNPHGHEHEIQTLIRTCVIKNVPIALNRHTADFLISSPLLGNGTKC